MSLREAAEAILKSVEGEMGSAYNRARAVCCGLGIDECCGSPEPEWDEADQLVMNTLAPIQNALRAALAEAEDKRRNVEASEAFEWIVREAWSADPTMPDGMNEKVELVRYALAEAEAPKAEPVALSDEQCDEAIRRSGLAYLSSVNESLNAPLLRRLCREALSQVRPPEPVESAEAELSDAEIIAIRDEHLPAQGEPFDCIAFARAVLAQGWKG